MEITPIGRYKSEARRKYDVPRQGIFDGGEGTIELDGGNNFEMALRDLEGFERIWVIFAFDRNSSAWRPTTRPPVAAPGKDRVGTFASRSPYRPNPIGLSCVRLDGIKGRKLKISESDLLDGTPILDIKPYVPAADAFPEAKAGWVDEQNRDAWVVTATDVFKRQCDTVRKAGAPDLLREATLQLSHDPFDATRKRVVRRGAGHTKGTLSLMMFRIDFTADTSARTLSLTNLRSGYKNGELDLPDDPYEDKSFHRALRRSERIESGESIAIEQK